MADRNPEWPTSLPLPSEIRIGPSNVHLVQADLATHDKIEDLVQDLYWHPDDTYYLFVPMSGGLNPRLHDQLESAGVERRDIDLYFYGHPAPAYANDFIRLLPNEMSHDWQQQIAEGSMYQRIKLSLQPGVRVHLSHAAIAAQSRDAMAARESVIDLKPNFYGVGLNLNPLLGRLKAWLGRKV